jgi:II/X family phage/plasmid replication protein
MGHNVYGGPLPPVLSCCWFVDNVAARLKVSLPYAEDWQVQRIDWAEAYELPSFEACEEYISGLNMAQFPRREVIRYGSESLMSPGRTTAVKVYHKGPEFHAHDRRVLRERLDPVELAALQLRANCILRFETSIKARKLTDDFSGKPQVMQLTQSYLESVHDREAARLLKEAKTEVETVRTHREVKRRLYETYETRLATTLFGTWLQLAALGEKEFRKYSSRATYFRQKKQLVEAGISWNAADVQVVPRCTAIPSGFSPVRLDPRRLTDEAEEVRLQLYRYQRAA